MFAVGFHLQADLQAPQKLRDALDPLLGFFSQEFLDSTAEFGSDVRALLCRVGNIFFEMSLQDVLGRIPVVGQLPGRDLKKGTAE